MDYNGLANKTSTAVARFNTLTDRMQELDKNLSDNSALQKHLVDYSKTRATYVEYRKAGYSKRFREAHEADIILHQAAKKYFDSLGLEKLPTVTSLRTAYGEQLQEKKTLYRDYRQVKEEMRELLIVKENVDRLLNLPDHERERSSHAHDQGYDSIF